MRPSIVLLITLLVLATLGCANRPEPVAFNVPIPATTLALRDNTGPSDATPVVVTTAAPSTSRPTSLPSTPPTVVPGPPLPEAPSGFCADLAAHSGDLMFEVEQILLDGDPLDGPTLRVLLITSRDLLVWTAARVPVTLASEVGALVGVYYKIGAELDRLDPGSLTEARIRGVIFTSVFGSSATNSIDLEVAAVRLAAFVNRSCGSGYPLLTSLGDLFSTTRSDGETGVDRDGMGVRERTTVDGLID